MKKFILYTLLISNVFYVYGDVVEREIFSFTNNIVINTATAKVFLANSVTAATVNALTLNSGNNSLSPTGLYIPPGNSISLGGLARTTWPAQANYTTNISMGFHIELGKKQGNASANIDRLKGPNRILVKPGTQALAPWKQVQTGLNENVAYPTDVLWTPQGRYAANMNARNGRFIVPPGGQGWWLLHANASFEDVGGPYGAVDGPGGIDIAPADISIVFNLATPSDGYMNSKQAATDKSTNKGLSYSRMALLTNGTILSVALYTDADDGVQVTTAEFSGIHLGNQPWDQVQ